MSILRADSIRNRAGTGAPDFPNGATVTGVVTATSFSGNITGNVTGNADTATALSGTPNIAVGTVTGTDATFSGNLTVNGTTTTIDTAVTSVDSLAVDGSITALGTLGIGTVTPGRHLTISGGASEGAIQITNNTSGHSAANGFELIHFTSGETQFLNRENGNMRFDTNGSEKLVIRSNGNIGIGTLNPGASDATLDIKNEEADIKLGNPSGHYFRFKSLSNGDFTINDNDVAERFRITSGGTAIFKGGLAEKINVKSQLTGANACAITDGNVILTTTNEPGNTYPNITGVHSVLTSGQGFSVTIALKVNGSGTINGFHIDGVSQTLEWSGGSAPSAGSSGYDVFTFSAFKTGSGTTDYKVFGSATNFD